MTTKNEHPSELQITFQGSAIQGYRDFEKKKKTLTSGQYFATADNRAISVAYSEELLKAVETLCADKNIPFQNNGTGKGFSPRSKGQSLLVTLG